MLGSSAKLTQSWWSGASSARTRRGFQASEAGCGVDPSGAPGAGAAATGIGGGVAATEVAGAGAAAARIAAAGATAAEAAGTAAIPRAPGSGSGWPTAEARSGHAVCSREPEMSP